MSYREYGVVANIKVTGHLITVFVQKEVEWEAYLSVQIIVNGRVVASDRTTAPYGVVTLSAQV